MFQNCAILHIFLSKFATAPMLTVSLSYCYGKTVPPRDISRLPPGEISKERHNNIPNRSDTNKHNIK